MGRSFSLVVFGATGFTGKYVVNESARQIGSKKWAIAGRKRAQLEELAEKASVHGNKPSVLVADLDDSTTLEEMCKNAEVIVNCVGPYRLYGEVVVKACIMAGTHYVDISGEPQFMESMRLKYHDEAKAKNIVIVSACGFDSVPAELASSYMRQLFQESKARCDLVESFLSLQSSCGFTGNYGTWHSAVLGIADTTELCKIRKSLKFPSLPYSIPRIKPRLLPFWNDKLQSWCAIFPGSDASVLRRTQIDLFVNEKDRPIQYHAYVAMKSIVFLVLIAICGSMVMLLTQFKVGVRLLLKYPRLFSAGLWTREGPSTKQLESTSFSMHVRGSGVMSEDPTTHVQKWALIHGPEPGYIATPIFLVACALQLANNFQQLPNGLAGVLTPGAAFDMAALRLWLGDHGIVIKPTEA